MVDPSHPEDMGGEDLWLEFIKVETAAGRTFDPLTYMVAARRFGEHNGETWEDIYTNDLSRLGVDLVSLVERYTEYLKSVGDYEVILQGVMQIADVLPIMHYDGDDVDGSKNQLLAQLFWALFGQKEYSRLEEVYLKGKETFAGASGHWILEALKDPQAYQKRLDQIKPEGS